jgi:branched-chain amino acid transport system ATP-binding protein
MSSALLDLQQCTVRFGGLVAVSAFDLQIGADDLIGLIGPNGAGKTTVFNVVTGVYRPSGGTISFQNMPIAGLKPSAIARRGIARTFQNIRLFATLSVFDNVRAGFNLRLRHGLAHALWRMGAFYREEISRLTLQQSFLRRSAAARNCAGACDTAETFAAR